MLFILRTILLRYENLASIHRFVEIKSGVLALKLQVARSSSEIWVNGVTRNIKNEYVYSKL